VTPNYIKLMYLNIADELVGIGLDVSEPELLEIGDNLAYKFVITHPRGERVSLHLKYPRHWVEFIKSPVALGQALLFEFFGKDIQRSYPLVDPMNTNPARASAIVRLLLVDLSWIPAHPAINEAVRLLDA